MKSYNCVCDQLFKLKKPENLVQYVNSLIGTDFWKDKVAEAGHQDPYEFTYPGVTVPSGMTEWTAHTNLQNGRKFIITTGNFSKKNVYIQSITLNGKPYKSTFIKHSDIVKEGELKFTLGTEPNKNWFN